MNIGAVIVAAGMSSRMGDFKPMLSIGSQSIAQRIVSTLRQAGADEIVSTVPELEMCMMELLRGESR